MRKPRPFSHSGKGGGNDHGGGISLRQILILSVCFIIAFLTGFNVRGLVMLSDTNSSADGASDGQQRNHSLGGGERRKSNSLIQPEVTFEKDSGKIKVQQHQEEKGEALEEPPNTQALQKKQSTALTLPPLAGGGSHKEVEQALGADDAAERLACLSTVRKHYEAYHANAMSADALRAEHGPLHIAGFSRLWVPPLHAAGGMQFHAYHLYSQLAAKGHKVHVFVTGPPDGNLKTLHFKINPETFVAEEVPAAQASSARLVVQQIASERNAEYSVMWFERCLEAFTAINRTRPFHVAHSESWAAVPNTFQLGLQMAVTWHGSMMDWFRNEINLIVHNFRVKGKMVGDKTSHRMSQLGSSVAYETYQLLSVPHHIVISDSAADDLAAINLVDPARIHLIYNGVNPTNFKPSPDRAAARVEFIRERAQPFAAWFDTAKTFVVGCGGRLDGIKGHHQLSLAMETILSQRKDVLLLVAGNGEQSYRYEKLRDAKGLRVVMLGMMKQHDLARFYQILDVFVDPYYQHHGLNTVMLEAVLSGVPIVASGLASSKTTAPCNQFGRTFQLGVISELVSAIIYFKDHPHEREEVGRNVRERAVNLFTSTLMAGRYEALMYEMYLHPKPLLPVTGKVVCRKTYPAMCYREFSEVQP